MPASNGGLTQPLNLMLIPAGSGTIYFFNTTNFNDPNSLGFFAYKVEDVIAGRSITINRIIISHRDLGPATITLGIRGTNDSGVNIFTTTTVKLGTVAATNNIMTVLPGLTLTGMNLQVIITRAANGGPVSITKVRVEGRIEKTSYA